jgi:hypothetical protein
MQPCKTLFIRHPRFGKNVQRNKKKEKGEFPRTSSSELKPDVKISPCQANFLSQAAFGSPPWNPQHRREEFLVF